MQRHFFSLRIAALVILAGIVVAALDLALHGYVVVHDPASRLRGAAIQDGGTHRAALRRYTDGYWVGRPTFDGTILLSCRSGTEVHRGYVTSGMATTHTVTADDCRPAR